MKLKAKRGVSNKVIFGLVTFGIFFLITMYIVGYKGYIARQWYNNLTEDFDSGGGDTFNKDNTQVLLINMKKNPDRLEHFLKEYDKTDLVDIPFTRVEGINGKTLNMQQYLSKGAYRELLTTEKLGYRTRHYQLTRGAVGCYLSHMHCYKMIRDDIKPFGIIFEDDVTFKHYNIMEKLNEYMKYIPDDWDVLLMHCVCYICGKHKYYYDINRFILMHAYVVKKDGAAKLMQLLEHKPIDQQIDSELSRLAIDGKIKIYSLRYPIAVQGRMGTNIQMPLKHLEGVNPYDLI